MVPIQRRDALHRTGRIDPVFAARQHQQRTCDLAGIHFTGAAHIQTPMHDLEGGTA